MGDLDVCDRPEALGLSGARLDRIGSFFKDKYVETGRLPGVITAVFRKGELAALNCSGHRDV